MIKTDGIIFDMDGTVWDNTPVFAPAWTRAAREDGYDVDFTPDRLKELFGRTMKEIADASIPDDNPDKRYETVHKAERYEMDDLRASDEDTCYPGLYETVKTLSKSIKLYVVSNCQSGYIELFMERTGLGEYFTDFICYGDNGLSKAENIKLIVERNNIKAPLYVGDIQRDLDASNAAGVMFLWAAYGYGDSVGECEGKIDSISQLPQAVMAL